MLRDYQRTSVADIGSAFANGRRRVLFQLPTGGGKTVIFTHMVADAVARGQRVCILSHRQEITDQIAGALTALGIEHGLIAAGHPETPSAPVQVCSVMTLVRRLDRLEGVNLLIIDEAHHAVAGTWATIINNAPDARVIGVTATPERLDGQGLGDLFEILLTGPDVASLVESGWLSRSVAYAPATGADLSGVRTRAGDYAVDQLATVMSGTMVIGSAVRDYTRLCPGAPAIAFCVGIEHSQLVAERFREAGYRAAHVDGDTDKDERRDLIKALGTGDLQILCNCGLISEGVDVPAVAAAILLRPTKSVALYLQQVGRALRPAPGKDRALILDHAGNIYRHGPADAPRAWSLEGHGRPGTCDPRVRRCPACGALNEISAFECSECGTELQHRPRPPRVEIDTATLIEVENLRAMSYHQALRRAGDSEPKLRLIAHARGYKAGWVFYRLKELSEQAVGVA